ncbi:MAG TPA: hypothetical protein VHO90_18620, partial [Bacteroidales bacterium]|nr:hypothetical protein [Bacteroidales bacterium]
MKLLTSFVILVLLTGCSKKVSESTSGSMGDSNSVTFTDAQLRMSEIKWGKLQKKDVSDVVESNGTIELPPQNTSTVTPLLGGNVKDVSDVVESNGTIELPPQNTSTVTPLL